MLTGDLNGDGFKDLVAPVPSANSVAVLLGNGTGGFAAPTLYPTGTGTHEGVILDLNGDGRLDIALEGLSDAFVLFGNGSRRVRSRRRRSATHRPSSPTSAPATSTVTAGRTWR